jgi:hypothetical protein
MKGTDMTIEAPDQFASACQWADSSKNAVGGPTLVPNRADMRAHVEHLFGGYLDGHHDGRLELAWTDTMPDAAGRYRLAHAAFFGTDQFDELVDEAVRRNAQSMCNVYIGAALRHPHTAPFGRARDDDFGAATVLWCDLDSADAVGEALANYADAKPTLLVMTGEHPHQRVQCWWRLAEAIDDPDRLRNALSGITCKMGGDTTVTNPSRVMRLAGSVAWPHKPGRVAELTRTIPLREPGLPEYLPAHLEQLFPPVVSLAAARERKHAQNGGDGSIIRHISALGLATGKVSDGREKYMRNMILAALIEYVGKNGAEPSVDELVAEAWPTYKKNTDLSRPGRGQDEFREKCAYTLRRLSAGKLPGLVTLDQVVEVWQKKQAARAAYSPFDAPQPARPQQIAPIQTVDFATLLSEVVEDEPDYIEPDFAGPGNFVLIAGPPKAQKSFLLQEMLVAAATGGPFLAGLFRAPRPLKVFYLQAEMNRKLLRKRAREMRFLSQQDRALLATNLVLSERFFTVLNEDGVRMAVNVINDAFPDDPPDIIAVDPLANVFDQDNENDAAQIMRFVTGRLEAIRQRVNPDACLVLVHHATKKSREDMERDPFVAIRGSGALRGHYDSAIVIFRASEEGAERKVHFELRGGESPKPMSVQLSNGRFVKSESMPSITKPVAREILAAIDAAWKRGAPWSPHARARPEGRYVCDNAARMFNVSTKEVDILVKQWLVNGIVTYRPAVSRRRPAGIEKTGSLD